MTKTLIDCISMAAHKLGANPISSLAETDGQNDDILVWSAIWEMVLARSLDAAPWRWASKTVELSRLSTAPAHPRYTFQFELPADYRTTRSIMSVSGERLQHGQYAFEDGVVLSVWDRLFITYGQTQTADDIPSMPTWFVNFYIAGLAEEAAYKLTGDLSLKSNLGSEMAALLQRAIIQDYRQEAPPTWSSISGWRASRWGR